MGIGEQIRKRRIQLGWSQQKLAEKMGYTSKSTITRIEKGYNDVSQSNVAKFAKVMDTTIGYLMGWNNEESNLSKPIITDDSNPAAKVFSSRFDSLSDNHQQQVLEYIDFLSAQEQKNDVARIIPKI